MAHIVCADQALDVKPANLVGENPGNSSPQIPPSPYSDGFASEPNFVSFNFTSAEQPEGLDTAIPTTRATEEQDPFPQQLSNNGRSKKGKRKHQSLAALHGLQAPAGISNGTSRARTLSDRAARLNFLRPQAERAAANVQTVAAQDTAAPPPLLPPLQLPIRTAVPAQQTTAYDLQLPDAIPSQAQQSSALQAHTSMEEYCPQWDSRHSPGGTFYVRSPRGQLYIGTPWEHADDEDDVIIVNERPAKKTVIDLTSLGPDVDTRPSSNAHFGRADMDELMKDTESEEPGDEDSVPDPGVMVEDRVILTGGSERAQAQEEPPQAPKKGSERRRRNRKVRNRALQMDEVVEDSESDDEDDEDYVPDPSKMAEDEMMFSGGGDTAQGQAELSDKAKGLLKRYGREGLGRPFPGINDREIGYVRREYPEVEDIGLGCLAEKRGGKGE